jgi:hypothetical protein
MQILINNGHCHRDRRTKLDRPKIVMDYGWTGIESTFLKRLANFFLQCTSIYDPLDG